MPWPARGAGSKRRPASRRRSGGLGGAEGLRGALVEAQAGDVDPVLLGEAEARLGVLEKQEQERRGIARSLGGLSAGTPPELATPGRGVPGAAPMYQS